MSLRSWRPRRRASTVGDPTRPQGWSLRRRLLLAVMGTSIGLWLVSLGIVIGVAWFAASDVLDEALDEGTRLVLRLGSQADDDEVDPGELSDDDDGPLQLRMHYQLVGADGRVLLRGEDTPQTAFVPDGGRKRGFSTVHVDGRFWRVHVRRGDNGVTAQVAQPLDDRLEMLEDMAENLAWPALALLALLGGLSWLLIRRLLRPLEDTAAHISAKSPQDLSPVQATDLPRELQPMLGAINALLARLDNALHSERRFTADAAHELRTPLAALRMRVQLIERELALPDVHLRQLRADADRCTALVESLLALARLEAEPPARETVDLHELVDALDLSAAEARGMRVERALAASRLHAAPALLASVLRNLVDNAVRYGHDGGRVRIESAVLPGGVRLAVRDDGPGVEPAERTRLGERFFRVLGTGQSGNGLGLSIVARIAALHGAALRFEDGLEDRGLSVVLDFPDA